MCLSEVVESLIHIYIGAQGPASINLWSAELRITAEYNTRQMNTLHLNYSLYYTQTQYLN